METFIIIAIIIIYLILIAWSWKNLGNLEKSKKIIYIVIGLIATYIFTYIIILFDAFYINPSSLQKFYYLNKILTLKKLIYFISTFF